MALILKQEANANVTTPPSGSGAVFINSSDQLTVKDSAGNISTIPTFTATNNTAVFFNDEGTLGESANLTFNKTGNILTVGGNVVAGGVKTDNLYYANGNPWDLQQPGGSNTQLQFNDQDQFGGSANLTFDKLSNTLTLQGIANITDINTTGNIVVGGNLTVNGNVTYVNVETLSVEDPIISIGGGPNGAPLTSDDGKDRGTALEYYDTSAKTAFMGWDLSNAEFGMASIASITNDVVTFSNYGNLRVGNIIGNGQALTGLAGANVTGQVGNALVAGTVYTNAQPNITSVGTLTSLDVSGNITAGNLTGANLVSANFLTGTLTTAAQPNITSVGKLTSVLIGSTANSSDFPNAIAISSQDDTGLTGGENIGLVGEGVGNGVEGIGLLGLARANGTQKATGVQGVATVTSSGDTGAAVGLRGYSTATHSGGYNIGVLGNAAGSGVGNYAFYIQSGGVASIEADTFWDLNDNSGAALAFSSSGKANILLISTVDGSEGVGMSGTLSVTGNANVGNLGAAAGVFTANVSAGNVDGGNLVTANFVAGTLTTAAQPNITSLGTLTGLSIDGNITGNLLPSANITYNLGSDTQRWNNLYLNGNTITLGSQTISANTTAISLTGLLSGNGGGLTNLNASNLASGTVSNARLDGTYTITVNGSANTVRDAAQANITSVGTLTGLSVDGSNITLANGTYVGNGAGLSSLAGANITGTVGNATHASTANTVVDAAQPNITSVGTLTSLAVTGNVTAGNVDGGNLVTANFVAGTLTTAAQPNVTSVGTLTGLDVNGNIIAANITANTGVFTGNGSGLSALAGANVTGTVANATHSSTANTVVDAAQPNITSVGTLTSLAVTGNASAGNISTGGVLSVTGNANVGNIGGTNGVFTNVSGNGSGLTALAGANVTGQVGNALVSGTVYTNAQPNITSVGTLTGLTLGGNLAMGNYHITGLAEPVNSTDAATKQYVDDVAQGLHTHDSCNAATDGTLATISGGTVTYNNGTDGVGATLTTTGSYTTIDSVTLSDGMRILVKNEANAAHNGIYVRSNSTVLTRATDFDTPAEMAGGDFTFVTAGTLYDNTGWVMTDPVTTVGTTDVNWVQFSGAGTYTAGTGLTLTGSQFSVNASQTQITSVGTLTSLGVSGTITASNITANTGVFTGNGSGLSAIAGANVTGTVSSATTAGTVTTAAQPNITSVGTLTSLAVTGNVSAGNVSATAGAFTSVSGNGSALTALNASNISSGTLAQARLANASVTLGSTALTLGDTVTTVAGLSSVTSTTFVGALTGAATTAGTVTTAAQPNITSVGTLSSLSVSGNANVGNIGAAAGVFTTVSGNGSALTALNASNITTGTLAQARLANSSLTVNGTAISLGGSGTITASTTNTLTLGSYLTGGSFNGGSAVTAAVDATTTNTASKVVARDSNGSFAANIITATLSGAATTAGTVTTAAQPNITSVGTLTSLTVSGTVNAGTLQSTALTTGANTTAGTVTGNFTLSAGSKWNATYADLAEKYVADAHYEPGTVLVFGGEHEVTLATEKNSHRVAGVVSTNPAYLMNAGCQGEHVVELALTGRVPVKVSGQVQKGDLMVTGLNGHAVANNFARAGTIIGKALENFVGESGVIEVVVGRV